MKYVCNDCGREISREELADTRSVKCPSCGSYDIGKLKEGEE